jgi:hypothetical protein
MEDQVSNMAGCNATIITCPYEKYLLLLLLLLLLI